MDAETRGVQSFQDLLEHLGIARVEIDREIAAGDLHSFVTKLLALRSTRMPDWALPLFGGSLVAVLTALWFTSSYWFFTTVGFPGL